MRQGASASRGAARMGRAAFLFPAGWIVPLSGRPPVTQNAGAIGRQATAALALAPGARDGPRVSPVPALGLLAAVGVLATRLPRLPPRRPPSLDLLFAAGAPLVLLGVVLGPGIELLDAAALRALAPVTALALGWLGAVLGARCQRRYVTRIPRRLWLLSGLEAFAVLLVVGLAAWLLARARPALGAAWTPRLFAVLALGTVAAASGPGAVALAAQALGVRRSVARVFGLAATLATAWATLALTLALTISPLRRSGEGGATHGWFAWLALTIGSGTLVGMLFLSFTRLRPDPEHVGVALLGAMLFGAGIGYAADLSPLVVCGLAAALIVNGSPLRRRVRGLLAAGEHLIYGLFLIITGAVLALPTVWVLAAAPILWALRTAAKWAVVRYAHDPLQLGAIPPQLGLATTAQGGLAVALGARSEERRVGKECRSRWSPYH